MLVIINFKGKLAMEFNIPANDLRSGMRWITRNIPNGLDADELSLKKSKGRIGFTAEDETEIEKVKAFLHNLG